MGDRRAEFVAECKTALRGMKASGMVDIYSVDGVWRPGRRTCGPVVVVANLSDRLAPRPSTTKVKKGEEWRLATGLIMAVTTKEIKKARDLAKLARDKLEAAVERALQERAERTRPANDGQAGKDSSRLAGRDGN